MDDRQKDTQAKMITSVVYIDRVCCVLVLFSIPSKCVYGPGQHQIAIKLTAMECTVNICSISLHWDLL